MSFKILSLYYVADSTCVHNRLFTGKPFPPVRDDSALQTEFFNLIYMTRDVTRNYLSDSYLTGHVKGIEELITFLNKTYGRD